MMFGAPFVMFVAFMHHMAYKVRLPFLREDRLKTS